MGMQGFLWYSITKAQRECNMVDTKQPIISIQDQIIEKMLSDLKNKEGFTSEIIQSLSELRRQGKLSKEKEISKILKPKEGGNDEAH